RRRGAGEGRPAESARLVGRHREGAGATPAGDAGKGSAVQRHRVAPDVPVSAHAALRRPRRRERGRELCVRRSVTKTGVPLTTPSASQPPLLPPGRRGVSSVSAFFLLS